MSNESRIHNTFAKTIYQIENLKKVFREQGRLATAIAEIGGDPAYLADVQQAFDTLYSALEEAEYGSVAHLGSQEESVQEGDQCNMTMEGEHCPVHGMNECGGSMPQSNELSSLKVLAGL